MSDFVLRLPPVVPLEVPGIGKRCICVIDIVSSIDYDRARYLTGG